MCIHSNDFVDKKKSFNIMYQNERLLVSIQIQISIEKSSPLPGFEPMTYMCYQLNYPGLDA